MKYWIEVNRICHRLWIQLFKEGRMFIVYESWFLDEIRSSQLMNYHVEIEIIHHRVWLQLFKEGVIFIVYESCSSYEIRFSQLKKVVFRLKEQFYSSIWPMEKRKSLDSGWRRGFDSYKRGVNRGWRLWDGSLSACPRRSRCRYG